jgi:hypothetical protein
MQYEIKSSLVDRKYSNFKVKNKTLLLNLSRGFRVHLITNRPECHSITYKYLTLFKLDWNKYEDIQGVPKTPKLLIEFECLCGTSNKSL